MGDCLKDRANRLSLGEFECSFSRFEQLFGKEMLGREARPTAFATDAQKRQIRQYIDRFEIAPDQVTRRLAAYGANSLDDLTEQNAQVILNKFESALAKQGEAKRSEKEA